MPRRCGIAVDDGVAEAILSIATVRQHLPQHVERAARSCCEACVENTRSSARDVSKDKHWEATETQIA